jgi:hypothetical protein
MPDPNVVLERTRLIAERIEPPADSFQRLVRYRTRRERNKRLAAAALALAVASIGTVGALASWSIVHGRHVPVGFGPILPSDDTGARHDLRVLTEVTVDGATFRVVRYRDGRGLYCQDVDARFDPGGPFNSLGGCNNPFPPPNKVIRASLASAAGPDTKGRDFLFVFGEVTEGVAVVRIRWSDGEATNARPQNGFFMAAREGPTRPTEVIAFRADERVLGRQRLGGQDCAGSFGGGYCYEDALGPPPPGPLPSGSRAVPFVPYVFDLYTHCGILWAKFDGRNWVADPPLTDGSGNPPAGWGNPSDHGTMELVSSDWALYRSDSGMTARFRPGPHPAGCD